MATKTTKLEIINVGAPTYTKTARGGYNSMELAYKNLSFDGKVEGKKLVDFNDKAIFAFVQDLKNGDVINVVQEKNEGDQYWKWVGVTLAGEGESASAGAGPTTGPAPQTVSDSVAAPKGRVTGSNYETSEERARRQVYIVRQSSITAALEFLKVAGYQGEVDGDLTTAKVIELAKEFEAYVFEPKKDGDIPF